MKAYTGAGAYLRVTDSAGTVLAESEKLTKNEGWVRLSAPFVLTDTTTVQVQLLADGVGMCHINAPQLEDGGCATVYNHLQNGCAEDAEVVWTGGTVSTDECLSGTGALQLTAVSVDAACCASQTVKPKMGAGTRETFTLSGWAKGVRLPDCEREESETPHFCLRAEVVYADENIPTETFTADFAPALEDWQFASVQFCKSHYATVKHIAVYCDYSYNEGTAYFDNLQLVRDTLETGLSAEDFVIESEEEEIEEAAEETSEETTEETVEETDELAFEEARDAFGNILTETTFTDGEFGTLYRAFGFNATGNDRTAETDVRGNTTEYDVNATTSRPAEVTDRCGNKTAYEYDTAGRTTKVTSKDANGTELAHVSYTYDAFDNMTAITRGDGMQYDLAYNPFHNLESIGVEGKTEKLVQYTYKNGNGRLKEITYANGDKMTASYNGQGQLIAEKWYDVSNTLTAHYKYVYDNDGNIVRSIDILASKEYTYTYEEGGIVRATESDIVLSGEMVTAKTVTNTVRYVYDSEGTLTKKIVTPANGTAQTTYYETTDENTVVKFKVDGKTVTSHSKTDAFGRKVFDELQLGTGFVSRQFIYHAGDVTDEHTENGLLKSSATTQLVSQIVLSDGHTLSYEYDNEERITQVIDSTNEETVVTTYTYDALGQLLTETVNGVAVNTMTYDNYGNITSKNGVPYTYGDSNWHDLLTAYNGQTITYDAQGNPTSYRGYALSWEKGRQLAELQKPDGTLLEYTYNANGIRTCKAINGMRHEYALDGTKILCETWGDDNGKKNTLMPLYDNEDSVCGILYNAVPYYFLKNLQGDIIAITDSTGAVKARYTYDAWGACTVTKDDNGIATINPFRYRGYYYDVETGLYYLQSRYYDPEMGRFINADLPELLILRGCFTCDNLYVYCGNCCVKYKDPYGYWYQETGITDRSTLNSFVGKIDDYIEANSDSRMEKILKGTGEALLAAVISKLLKKAKKAAIIFEVVRIILYVWPVVPKINDELGAIRYVTDQILRKYSNSKYEYSVSLVFGSHVNQYALLVREKSRKRVVSTTIVNFRNNQIHSILRGFLVSLKVPLAKLNLRYKQQL